MNTLTLASRSGKVYAIPGICLAASSPTSKLKVSGIFPAVLCEACQYLLIANRVSALGHIHGAQSSETNVAWVDLSSNNLVAVGCDRYVEENISLDGRNGHDVDHRGPVGRCIGDIEETGCESRVILAGIQRTGLQQLLCRRRLQKGGGGGEK